ncbi:YafY family protein [Paenibacillus xylanexedens]|uniref:helix-turn-helix transcriptional regulator n=1 Tax=Paenibacillus xylanexedens TaxID=528191 RepID=UPI0011A0C701|nr:WYL domain-containing protein [Paenibacillus xylanexedens]
MNYKSNKGFRLLNIYERLNKGEMIDKANLATDFGVTQKTIQRDIDDLRAYLAEMHYSESDVSIRYDRRKNVYYLVRFEREWLANSEVMALCKILLESRAFAREELDALIGKLLKQVVPNDRKQIQQVISNEQHHYVPLKHNKPLIKTIWKLSLLISKRKIIKFNYTRQDGSSKTRFVKPLAIMFSEYYFYLIAYMEDGNNEFPKTFRVDRISGLAETKRHFNLPYRDKFNEGEFRKRVQFMYSGELMKIVFNFSGPSLEAVLDRLPTAEIISENNGIYTIQAEVYGTGIDMWLRSQGQYIQVLEEQKGDGNGR